LTYSSAAPVVALRRWLGVRLGKTQTEAKEPLDDMVKPPNSRNVDAKTAVLILEWG